MVDTLKIYHTMPYSLRVIIASLRGAQLQSQRYGPQTDKLITQALEVERWSFDQVKKWQESRLAEMLWHAENKVPYYRKYWENQRGSGNRLSSELLQNWPILTKQVIREQPTAFIMDGIDISKQHIEHTSGTSGTPLSFWVSKDAIQNWYALFEARWRGWYGLTRQDRWGILGGQLVVPFSKAKPPFWVWNLGMKQLYLSSYHLREQNIAAYLNAIEKHQLVYLLGYASSLYTLAKLALEQNLAVPPLKTIISNAEPLYSFQREIIAKAFNCPVHDTYGQSENVCAASECAHGNLHLWPEVGITEILQDTQNQQEKEGNVGRLICTGILNKVMPLIRYEVGDRAAIVNTPCECGRTLPILSQIDGRIDDVIETLDGRKVGRLDPIFKTDMPIREAQIIQESLENIRVKVVPTGEFGPVDIQNIITRVQQRLGETVHVEIETVLEIPRTKSGKFQAVISLLKKP